MQKPKIFIGLVNIASILSDFKKSFSKLGYETITAIHQNHSVIVSSQVDYDFSTIRNKKSWYDNIRPYKLRFLLQYLLDKKKKQINTIYQKIVQECDIFIFIWSSFQPDFSDIAYLKSIGKKVVCIHVGDDVRYAPAMQQEFALYDYQPIGYSKEYLEQVTAERKLLWLRTSEKYADLVYSRADQNQLGLRPHYKWRMMVIPSDFEPNYQQNKTNPLVIHSPSNREVKGTKYVLEAVERLKQEGEIFDFQLIENMPHEEALKTYQKADIIIDQLLCPGAGKFATECMAMGRVVMGKMGYGIYPDNIPAMKDNPIVDSCPKTIYENLKSLIHNHELRCELSLKGPEYVKKHLNFDLFCERMLELLDMKNHEYEYYPTFFREKYIPEPESIEIYNQWTSFVKDCDWYKQYIPRGERDGLIF
jgi:hypothetical protein